jgi:hypothetical protein
LAQLVIIAHVPTHAVTHGFLPAAARLGLDVALLTDKPEENAGAAGARILPCDVFNPVSVIDCICNHDLRPAAIFSNSDHLQTSTAMAAQFFQVPHKPVAGCYRAKHKGEMRRCLERQGIETVWHRLVRDRDSLNPVDVPFPCVVKPCKGVASLGVRLAHTPAELQRWADEHFAKRDALPLLIEEYLEGTIYSLETLGDADGCHVLGGFTCSLGEPPAFIETAAEWGLGAVADAAVPHVLRALHALEATWGACHTEFVAHAAGPKIIEVNYRSIGDQSDFMLNHLLGGRYFESVLRVHLGETLQLPPVPAEAHSAARYLFAQRSGRIAALPDGYDRREDDLAITYVPARKPNDVIELSHSNKDYLAMLHVTGTGRERVERHLQQEIQRVEESIQWA